MNPLLVNNNQIYRDYSNLSDSQMSANGGVTTTEKSFPVNLHYALREIERDGQDHIISWQPHGRCFVIHDRAVFEKIILPIWFQQEQFSSFQRSLTIYGFCRITYGVDKGGYFHEKFLRGKPLLARTMQRIKVDARGPRRSHTLASPPNFYAMPPLPAESSSIEEEQEERVYHPAQIAWQRLLSYG